ncbi:MAG: NUDIX domain-containing protein [Candidatus Bilamarchaeum sp.]|jgi:8-oxo-dGTP diphosphatase
MMRPLASDSLLIENGRILLVERKFEPFKGYWAIPGGMVELNESAEECAIREMQEETGLSTIPYQLVGVYSDPKRDPRGVVAVVYLVRKVGGVLLAGTDAKSAKWFDLDKLPKLAADHLKIIEDAKLKLIKN